MTVRGSFSGFFYNCFVFVLALLVGSALIGYLELTFESIFGFVFGVFVAVALIMLIDRFVDLKLKEQKPMDMRSTILITIFGPVIMYLISHYLFKK